MKTFIVLIFVAAAGVVAVAQEDARDIAREMGADTTTSVSPGTDRHGVHRDTQTVVETRLRAPDLLDSAQKPKVRKLSETERRRLTQERKSLLKERTAYTEKAVTEVKEAKKSAMSMTAETKVNEASVRKKAQQEWDAKKGAELQAIDRTLKKGAASDSEARLRAPALIKPD